MMYLNKRFSVYMAGDEKTKCERCVHNKTSVCDGCTWWKNYREKQDEVQPGLPPLQKE